MPDLERLTHVWMIMRTHTDAYGHDDDRWDDGVVYASKEAAEAVKAGWDARQAKYHEEREDKNQRQHEERVADMRALVAAGRRPMNDRIQATYKRSTFRSDLYVEAVELSYGES